MEIPRRKIDLPVLNLSGSLIGRVKNGLLFSFLLVNIEMGFNGIILNFIGHDYGLLGGGLLPFDMNAERASPIYDPWLELVKLRNESLSIVSHNTGWCELSPE